MNVKVEIQFASNPGCTGASYDVLVGGDHYMSYWSHAEAVAGAQEAAGGIAEIVDHTTS